VFSATGNYDARAVARVNVELITVVVRQSLAHEDGAVQIKCEDFRLPALRSHELAICHKV
jgi:hypothetical protein